MKEITIPVLWAATEYYLGALLWAALAGAALGLMLWVFALRRQQAGFARAFKPAIILGLLAGVGFAASVPALTRSNWSYVAGAADFVLIVGTGVGVAVAVAYVLTPLIMLTQSPRA